MSTKQNHSKHILQNSIIGSDNTKNIGLYDPLGINNNPLTNEPYKNIHQDEILTYRGESMPRTYANLSKIWTNLMVYNNKDIIIDTIKKHQIILATAGTGVGKTILIPRMALHTFDYKEKIICTVPKRLPTYDNASFVAECLDVKLGEHVGYYYQGANETNRNGIDSKLIFTTTGSLISRMTGNDPLLSDYKCVIIDEAHERSVETDQLLLLLKKLCLKRKDIKVIIMSATIDLDKFRDYYPKPTFNFGEVHAGSELTHPVQEIWIDRPADWKKLAIDITIKLLKKTAEGDIMIFVKSAGDANQICMGLNKAMIDFRKEIIAKHATDKRKTIKKSSRKTHTSKTHTSKTLSKHSRKTKSFIIPPEYSINPICIKLEGTSPKDEQKLATDSHKYKTLKDEKGYPYTRKIVVTTNVAESSLTVDGIVYIIDSGYEYAEAYEPNSRVRSLLENTIAQSAVKQRKGRAGRTRPGVCFHLYSEKEYKTFDAYPIPSIEKKDLTNYILDLMRLPEASTIKKMRSLLDEFISPPHEKFILDSIRTLEALGAITTITDEGKITPMGSAICKFRAIKPTFARSLIASHFYGCSRSMCDIVALATVADGMMEKIFIEFYPDKKKTPAANKQEEQKHRQLIKSYEHPFGDYMTLLKVYKLYLKQIGENQQLQNIEQPVADNIEAADLIENSMVEADNMQIKPSVKKWCREHYLNAKNLARIRTVSKQLYQTLQLVLRPYKHRNPVKLQNAHEIHEASIIDVNAVMDEVEMEPVPKTDNEILVQSGGFVRQIEKEEELEKLEKNVRRFDKEEDNLMMSLAIGNFVNLAIKAKGQKDTYISCFANVKKFAKINMDSFIRNNPNIVLYDEIFMISSSSKFLKLNMVNKIPDNVWARIKQNYGKFIKMCI
jgi:pre-mRNA-splicing factor ATP-dependent RNA helicase DHX15/PRP43